MKKILLALFCLMIASTARACPPLAAFAAVQPCFSNAVLLPSVAAVQVQAVAVQPAFAVANVGYGGFGGAAFVGGGFARAGFVGGGFGARAGFVGGGFRGPRVTAFSRTNGLGGGVARVRVR